MRSGQIFRHSSRLNPGLDSGLNSDLSSGLSSGLSSPLLEKDVVSADWLLRVLPDFGIVQLDGRRTASIVEQFENLIDIPLVRWNCAEQFASFAELLADALAFPSADHVYLQHSLRVWAEKGGVLWVLVEGDAIPNEQLIQLLRYRPLSRSGQFAIRILLKVSEVKRHDKSFAALADVIHERVGESLPVKRRSFNHGTFKVCASYLLILVLSAASMTATWYIASQEKSALAKTEVANVILQPAIPESRSIDTLLPVRAVSEMDTPEIDSLEVDSPDSLVESVSLNEKSQVIGLIDRWSRAWQQQNIDEYFSIYSHGYSAYKYMSSKEWRNWRTARLKKPLWISIEIGPVAVKRGTTGELNGASKRELHATFWQLYRSPGYQDDTLKTLVLRQESGIWKIADEINEEVRPLSQK